MEILDHVDENDNVIGTVERELANSDPKYTHREVGILLFNKEGKILWQKRSMNKKVHPGVWSVTAGHVEAGKDPDDVAHVELQEELGFDTELTFFDKILKTYPNETHFMYYYIGEYDGQEIQIQQSELEEVRWVSMEDLEDMMEDGEEVNASHFNIIRRFVESS